jgi:hypothetical protein
MKGVDLEIGKHHLSIQKRSTIKKEIFFMFHWVINEIFFDPFVPGNQYRSGKHGLGNTA